jgi:hypothetical protein
MNRCIPSTFRYLLYSQIHCRIKMKHDRICLCQNFTERCGWTKSWILLFHEYKQCYQNHSYKQGFNSKYVYLCSAFGLLTLAGVFLRTVSVGLYTRLFFSRKQIKSKDKRKVIEKRTFRPFSTLIVDGCNSSLKNLYYL